MMGQDANDCPNTKEKEYKINKKEIQEEQHTGFSFAQYDVELTHVKSQLKPMWVLLDMQSSCNIFNNKDKP